jgi:transposase
MEAGERFAVGDGNAVIAEGAAGARALRPALAAAWAEGGLAAMASKGPANHPRLSAGQFAALEAELERGAVAQGWPDRIWTLSRIETVIERRFHTSCTARGVYCLLVRGGWSHRVPGRRAVERDEAAIAGWVKETWPGVETPGRRWRPGWSSRTRPGSP